MQIDWSDEARNDLASVIGYIAERHPQAAKSLRRSIEEALTPALEHPYLYRRGKVAGTREIVVHPNYILVYRVLPGLLEVLRVLHARQNYP